MSLGNLSHDHQDTPLRPGGGLGADSAARLRDELLNGGLFYTLWEAQVVIERWRQAYDRVRPNGALGTGPQLQQRLNRTQ